jgi:hypothetical protein
MNTLNTKYLQDKYNLSYHIPYLLTAEQEIGLRGKSVLEIGGSLPRSLVLEEIGAARWIAIEELEYYEEINKDFNEKPAVKLSEVETIGNLGDYRIVSGRAEQITPVFFEQFDAIFSIAAFEHIDRMPLALLRM